MPMHDFQCRSCQCEFEELVLKDEAVKCPTCGSADTNKLMSCCRFSMGGDNGVSKAAQWRAQHGAAPSAKSGCAGCSGGSCSTC
jgi:putative FmdB family regulatory protein